MCETCGCSAHQANVKDTESIGVLSRLLDVNDRVASHNRDDFDNHRVVAFNIMSSPGAGKTVLLEATVEALKPHFRIAVIEGDLETDNDARRIRAHDIPAVQITTGGACHLDASMVHEALHDLPLGQLDVLFIENVGNLVCPASFDLGQHRNIVLLSATEGDDKPAKYPVMFRAANLVLLTKMDLAPMLDDFEPLRAEKAVRNLANAAPVIPLSARKQLGLDRWEKWLRAEIANIRAMQQTARSASEAPHEHHHRTAVA